MIVTRPSWPPGGDGLSGRRNFAFLRASAFPWWVPLFRSPDHPITRFDVGALMIVMKFGATSVQDAQAIDRVAAIVCERRHENLTTISALTIMLATGNDPAPEARSRLAPGPPTRAIFAWRGGGHPETSNAKPEGWVGHKIEPSPVGASQKIILPCLTDNLFPSSTFHPKKKQVSGHEFTRAVQQKKRLGFSPCKKTPRGLKAKLLESHTARLKSCPDTCLARVWMPMSTLSCYLPLALLHLSASPRLRGGFAAKAFLRASVPPWWIWGRP